MALEDGPHGARGRALGTEAHARDAALAWDMWQAWSEPARSYPSAEDLARREESARVARDRAVADAVGVAAEVVVTAVIVALMAWLHMEGLVTIR